MYIASTPARWPSPELPEPIFRNLFGTWREPDLRGAVPHHVVVREKPVSSSCSTPRRSRPPNRLGQLNWPLSPSWSGALGSLTYPLLIQAVGPRRNGVDGARAVSATWPVPDGRGVHGDRSLHLVLTESQVVAALITSWSCS